MLTFNKKLKGKPKGKENRGLRRQSNHHNRIKICELTHKEFKITMVNTLRVLIKKRRHARENRQCQQSGGNYFQTPKKMLEIKNKKIKNAFSRLISRLDTVKERIVNFKIVQ